MLEVVEVISLQESYHAAKPFEDMKTNTLNKIDSGHWSFRSLCDHWFLVNKCNFFTFNSECGTKTKQNCPFTFDCSEGAVYSTFQLNWPWGKLRIQSRMPVKLLLCLNMIRPLLYPEVNTTEVIQKSVLTSQQTMNPGGYFTSHRGNFISQATDLTSSLILW